MTGKPVTKGALAVGFGLGWLVVGLAAAPVKGAFLNNGVTAHRGNSGEYPENTLPALRSGIDVGADWIEVDIFRTRDGKLVVTHDRTTARVGDRNLDVAKSNYAELLKVDVATEFRRRNKQTLAECPKQTMPLLSEVIEMVKKQRRTRLSIQPKMACVADAVALIKRMNAEAWVGFNDGNLEYMSEVKRLAPDIPVFWDRGDSDLAADIRTARERGFKALVLNHRTLTRAKVELIHKAGLEAGVWTVNDEAELGRFLKMGVDRIYTDYPARLLRLRK
jgi:glycerophosphoryl diester phosphodiesterase